MDSCAMKDWQRTRLDTYLMIITKDLDIKDTILKLRVRNLINADDEQLILNDSVHKVDSEKRQKIVDIIKTRGERAYWAFCHIIKTKTPFIFDILHKYEEGDVEKICPDCSGEDDISKCCNCCSGLISVLSTPEFGVFVQRPEEIIEAFQSNQKQKELLTSEVDQHKCKNEKLNKINRELLDSKSELVCQLEVHKIQVAEKQKEIEAILIQKEESKTEKETLNLANDDLKRKVQILETELVGEKETLTELDQDPIYENYIKVESLECDVDKKTLEELLQRQKVEHDRVFTMLQNKLQCSESSLKGKEEEIVHQKEYVKVIDSEKNDVVKERNHLLKKVYEQNESIKDTQATLKTIEQDKDAFEKLYENQQTKNKQLENKNKQLETKNKQLETKIEELYKHNEKLKQENEELKKQYNVQESSGERRKLTPVENDEDQVFLPDKKFKKLEEENKLLKNSLIRRSDKTVVLKKIEDKFGVKFGMKKGPLLLGESRIIITSISETHLVTTNINVETHDYVILVNNENVQEADINVVRSIIVKNNESMNLVIRKPARRLATEKNIKLNQIICEKFKDLGLRLAVSVALEKTSITREYGLQEMDEIVKINNKNADTLSIGEIEKLITKYVKQRQCDLTVRRNTMISDEEIEGRQRMGLNLSSDDTASSMEHKRYVSESSDVSMEGTPLSPTFRTNLPKLPPRGISTSTPNLLDTSTEQVGVHQYTENYASGTYQRVVTKEYDSKGALLNDGSADSYENKLMTVDVIKKEYEAFGLHITGGNKSGIYVEALDTWKPAEKANIQVGWRLLQVNGLSLEKVAFCYANEVLQKFQSHTKVTFNFEKTPMEHYKKMMRKRPYDAFHIRTLVDYTARDSTELSFKEGEILCVNDSYVMDNPNQPYKWQATKDDGQVKVNGFIPRQISNRAPSSIMEHTYEEIDPVPDSPSGNSKKQKNILSPFARKNQSPGPDRLYKILDPVGEVLV